MNAIGTFPCEAAPCSIGKPSGNFSSDITSRSTTNISIAAAFCARAIALGSAALGIERLPRYFRRLLPPWPGQSSKRQKPADHHRRELTTLKDLSTTTISTNLA